MATVMIPTLIGLLLATYIASCYASNLTFRQPNFHLEFNSFDLDCPKSNQGNRNCNSYQLNVSELLPILELISAKFSNIYLHSLPQPQFGTYSETRFKPNAIAEAVAIHNKQDENNKLELFLTVNNDSHAKSPNISEVLDVANHANSIFPGSVTHILTDFYYLEGNKKILNDQEELHFPFKFAVVIWSEDCEREDWFGHKKIPGIENVNLVILNLHAKRLWPGIKLEKQFSEAILEYEKCKNKLEKLAKWNSEQEHPEVGLGIKWFAYSHGRNSELSQLWILLNKWSVENNVKVFNSNAFEQPGLNCETGRWKVIGKSRTNIQFEDKFELEDKIKDYYGELKIQIPHERNDGNHEDDFFKQSNFHLELNSVSVHDWVDIYTLNVNQLLPILKLISAKYSKIYFALRVMPWFYNSKCEPTAFPEAVALHNKENPENKIELLLKICQDRLKNWQLDRALEVANHANSIFPGSVTHIFVDIYELNENLTHFEKHRLGYPYKLGVIIADYQDKTCHTNTLKLFDGSLRIDMVDLIILHLDRNSFDPRMNKEIFVEDYILKMILKYEACKKNIEQILKKKSLLKVPEIGLRGWWLANSGDSKWDLMEFWTTVNKWSMENNVKVFISQAFDGLHYFFHYRVAGGRWRVTSSQDQNNQVNVQLKDEFEVIKGSTIENDYENWDRTDLNKRNSTNKKSYECCPISNDFKQANFNLEFNAFYVDGSGLRMYDLEVDEILPILKVVSTKFSKIYTHTINSSQSGETYKLNSVPEAVAVHNTQEENKLELLMNIYTNSIKSNEFGNALQVANYANSISPGSVTYLLAEFNMFTGRERKLGKEKDLGGSYKFGVIISIAKCNLRHFVSQAMSPLVENVDLIILNFRFKMFRGEKGLKEFVSEMILDYEACKDKINRELKLKPGQKHPELGLRIKWSSLSSISDSDLNQIWMMLNCWSIENGVKLFISNAFQDTWRRDADTFSNGGRWKVISLNRSRIRFVDKFERKEKGKKSKVEKIAVANPKRNAREGAKNEENGKDLKKIDIEIPPTTSEKGVEHQESRIIGLIVGIALVLIVTIILSTLFIKYKRRHNRRRLTRKEMRVFYKGSKSLQENPEGPLSANDCVSTIETEGYKKEFEVDKESFKLSGCRLGSGCFGEVWKGTVIKSGVEIEVAAKMLKKGCRTSTLKGLLSEIKVMGYLGHHENLVGMVGAYTKGLGRGEVIVFTEFCEKGSLETYLRNLEKAMASGSKRGAQEIDLNRLLQWSFEIANGMEYVTSKNVVHADLATRNVLLNDKLQAKISDFGLSRKLYDYTNYVKKQQEPLPWKWMSPESLKRLEFNEKTDVWAFGVTMWEIYSLGDIPYPGLNWTVDFPTQLINGLRMEKPLYDNGEMYTIMLKCWNFDATNRPAFSQLKAYIYTMGLEPAHDQAIDIGYKNVKRQTKKSQRNSVA